MWRLRARMTRWAQTKGWSAGWQPASVTSARTTANASVARIRLLSATRRLQMGYGPARPDRLTPPGLHRFRRCLLTTRSSLASMTQSQQAG